VLLVLLDESAADTTWMEHNKAIMNRVARVDSRVDLVAVVIVVVAFLLLLAETLVLDRLVLLASVIALTRTEHRLLSSSLSSSSWLQLLVSANVELIVGT
jgi:hypothetical protein